MENTGEWCCHILHTEGAFLRAQIKTLNINLTIKNI